MYLSLIISSINGSLWILHLSIMITEFRPGNRFIWVRRMSMNSPNFLASKEPMMMLTWRILESDMPRSIEYLNRKISAWWEATFERNILLSSCKEAFLNSMAAFNGPCSTTIYSMPITCTLVHKYKLFWWKSIGDCLHICSTQFGTSLHRYAGQLWLKVSEHIGESL